MIVLILLLMLFVLGLIAIKWPKIIFWISLRRMGAYHQIKQIKLKCLKLAYDIGLL